MSKEKPIAEDASDQLALLKMLEGEWKMTAYNLSFSKKPGETIDGKMSARFVYDGMFLETKTSFPGSPIPTATAVIGLDDTHRKFMQLYGYVRGGYRVHEMTLTKTDWTLLRHPPDFHQRSIAKFETGGRQIRAAC